MELLFTNLILCCVFCSLFLCSFLDICSFSLAVLRTLLFLFLTLLFFSITFPPLLPSENNQKPIFFNTKTGIIKKLGEQHLLAYGVTDLFLPEIRQLLFPSTGIATQAISGLKCTLHSQNAYLSHFSNILQMKTTK